MAIFEPPTDLRP